LDPIQQIEWQTRVVSTVHAGVAFSICFYIWLTSDHSNFDMISGKTSLSHFCFVFGIGYFLSDFTVVLGNRLEPMVPILLHHLFASWAFFTCVSEHGQGAYLGTIFLLTEATNPWNNAHWMLQKSGRDKSTFFRIVELGYTISWVVFRMAVTPYLCWKIYFNWTLLTSHMSFYHLFILFLNLIFLSIFNTAWFITGPFYDIVFIKKEIQQLKKKKAA